jgi:hypothetical protein
MAVARRSKGSKSTIESKRANRPGSSGKSARPYVPQDQLTGSEPNFLLGADLIELTALFAADSRAIVAELTSTLEIGQDEYENLEEMLEKRDRLTTETTVEIESRARLLGEAYPFELDDSGSTLIFIDSRNWGRTLYILALVLSHLPSERSPVLERAGLSPDDAEIVHLRRWFQYCATASVAAEIGGDAWAFGWPRPDGSAFLDKLKSIWTQLQDGDVREGALPGSPRQVKDDEIDIIAARQSCDGLHGFPIILAQVASGNNWLSKPLRGHADHVFYPEWFSTTPASQTLVYHIIPFVIDREGLRRDTRRLGHLMHRLRLSARAFEAYQAVQRGTDSKIEGTEAFEEVDEWTNKYRSRGRVPNEAQPRSAS